MGNDSIADGNIFHRHRSSSPAKLIRLSNFFYPVTIMEKNSISLYIMSSRWFLEYPAYYTLASIGAKVINTFQMDLFSRNIQIFLSVDGTIRLAICTGETILKPVDYISASPFHFESWFT
jgi:hypothetical protein